LFLRTYSGSDKAYFTNEVVNSSVGQDNLAAETSSRRINGTNGSTSSFYYRNLRILDAFDDEYGGVVVDSDRIPSNPYTFASLLRLSLFQWKKMVNSLSIFSSSLTWTLLVWFRCFVVWNKTCLRKQRHISIFHLLYFETESASMLYIKISDHLQGKKGIWLKLQLEQSDLVPIAVKVIQLLTYLPLTK